MEEEERNKLHSWIEYLDIEMSEERIEELVKYAVQARQIQEELALIPPVDTPVYETWTTDNTEGMVD